MLAVKKCDVVNGAEQDAGHFVLVRVSGEGVILGAVVRVMAHPSGHAEYAQQRQFVVALSPETTAALAGPVGAVWADALKAAGVSS